MKNQSKRLLWIVSALLFATLACQAFAGDSGASTGVAITESPPGAPTLAPEQPQVEPSAAAPEETKAPGAEPLPTPESPFPLPDDVQNFDLLDEEAINFQTGMSMDEVIAFYRDAFSDMGLAERTLTTNIEETAFSLVFDGASNGKSVVFQGFILSEGIVNVNIRYEVV